jgi:hypothetical protein
MIMKTKTCTGCKTEKPETEFGKKYDRRGPRRKSKCNTCRNTSKAEKRKQNRRLWKIRYGGKCIKCGYEKCLAALDFHHREPDWKDYDPGTLYNMYNPETAFPENVQLVVAELEKCDLICSNCHREIHWGDQT